MHFYREIRLPRIIVCSSTENDIPQIVVADSERKDRDKCFENLTGKLTESLTMQEKLVKENAQLEGGKYVHISYMLYVYYIIYIINFKRFESNID
jgi:hypothetical protein